MCICEEKRNIILSKRKVFDIFETEVLVITSLDFKTGKVYTKVANYSPNLTTSFCLSSRNQYVQNFTYCPFCGKKLDSNNKLENDNKINSDNKLENDNKIENEGKFIDIFTIQDINRISKRQKTNFILPQNYHINYNSCDTLYIQEEHIIDKENIIYKLDTENTIFNSFKFRPAKELDKKYVRYKIKINSIKNINIKDITIEDIENFGTDCDNYDIIPSLVLRQDFVFDWNDLEFVKVNSEYRYENNPYVSIYNFNLLQEK